MAENIIETDNGNAYGLRLTLLALEGRGVALERILSSLTDWIDPSKQIVDVDEMPPEEDKRNNTKRQENIDGCLVTPAISVMLFVRETGNMCVEDVERVLKKPPWHFHHKVELHNKNVPKTPLAKQEFYKLADDLPLFAACPVLTENEHLRVNLYVHNFPAMVEFYRTITDTEIETNKPEFCVFELFRQPGLDIQLSLKRSPYIYPVPVESAYVSFNIKNIKVVELVSDNEVEYVGGNVYTTRDPDGNLVVLYETEFSKTHDCSNLAGACKICKSFNTFNLDNSTSFDDVKSLKSTAGSHDSGRYSDLDGPNSEHLVQVERSRQSDTVNKRKSRNQSEKSEGYASSSSSSLTLKQDNTKRNDGLKGKTTTGSGKTSGKPSSTNKTSSNDKKKKTGKQITPVYI